MPCTRWNSSPIFRALSRVIPLMLLRRSGSSSKMCRVLSPKVSTIRAAVAAPIPLIAPEDRYFSIATAVAGLERSNASTLNCVPKFGWLLQLPITRSSSPALTQGMVPTTVTSSWPLLSSNTVYPFFSFRKTTRSTEPVISRRVSSYMLVPPICRFLACQLHRLAAVIRQNSNSNRAYTGRLSVRPV